MPASLTGTQPEIYFDVWAFDDLVGTALGELTDAYDRTVRDEWNGQGTGEFTVNLHDSQAAWCTPGNLVRVRLATGGPFAYNDARYKFAFWITEGQDAELSADEEGGEELKRSGPGIQQYMEDAVLDPEGFADGTGTPAWQAGVLPRGTFWKWVKGNTPGDVLIRLIAEAQAAGRYGGAVLTHLTYDFDAANDSAGNPWTPFVDEVHLNVGIGYQEAMGILGEQKIVYRMSPGFVLSAYENYANDISGSVSFTDGVNIVERSEREVHASPAKSKALVKGMRTSDGRVNYHHAVNDTYEAELGRVKEGYVEAGSYRSEAELDKAGLTFLRTTHVQAVGPITLAVVPGDGTRNAEGFYLPYDAYKPGDTISLNGTDKDVSAIVLTEDEGGNLQVALELEGEPFTPSEGDPSTDDSGTGDGSGDPNCSQCPPFIPPNPSTATGTVSGIVYIQVDPWHVTANSFGDSSKVFTIRINRTSSFSDPVDNDPSPFAPNTDACTFSADSTAGDGTGVVRGGEGIYAFTDIQFGVRYYVIGKYTSSFGLGTGYSDGNTPVDWAPLGHGSTSWVPPTDYVVTYADEAGGIGGSGSEMLIGSFIITPTSSAAADPTAHPESGQPVVGTDGSREVVGTGDGSTTTFHTAFPYMPGTLHVFVDNLEQAATQTDPSTGAFTLPFAPLPDETITVDYAGAGTPAVFIPSGAACTTTYTGDSTGATDVTASLQNFINNTPNNSTICFATAGTYKITGQIRVFDRSGLFFKGSGTTWHQTVRGTDSIVRIVGGTNIAFEGITVQGSNPSPGVWNLTYEHNHAWAIWGTVGMDFNGCGVLNVGGDGLYFTNNGTGTWSNTINFHDGVIDGTGRMGVAVTDGARNITIEDNVIKHIGYYTFDIEPNGHTYGGVLAGGVNIIVRNNTMGPAPYAASGVTPYVFAVTGSSGGGPADGVTFSGNTITGVMWVGVFNNGGLRRNIIVTGNTASATAGAGAHDAVMVFQGVNTLTVTHNTQAVSGVSLIQDTGGSGTHVTSPNP